jgi:ABC-type glycerol-3-phosphate transport system substrate-binding protein
MLRALGSAAAASVLLSACGGAATPTPAPAAPTAAAPAAPAAPTATSAPAAAAAAPTATSAPAAAAAAPTATTAPAPAATPTTAPAAAASGPTATPNPLADVQIKPGKPVVEWWWPWGGMTGLNALAGLAKDFNASHDDFQVKALQIETWGGGAKLLSAIAANTAPAVETGGTWYDFWLAGGAQPVDDYIKASKVIKTSDMFESMVQGGILKGKTYGVPAVECFLRWEMAANQALLEKNKLPTNELPTDYDTLYQWAKQMTVVDSSGAVKVLGFDPLDAEGAVWGGDPFYWTAAMNYKYYDADKNQYTLNSDPIIKSMDLITKYVDIVGAEKLAGFAKAYGTWTESPTAMFPTGIEGININGYWAPGELVKSSPNNKFVYGWVPTPTKGEKLACVGGHYSIVPKGSPDPDRGFQIIEYLNSKPAMDIIYEVTGWLGASKAYLAAADVSKYPGLDFYVKAATNATRIFGPFFEPIPSFASDQFYKLLDEVTYHKTTSKEAAAKLQAAVDAEMKNRFPNGI